MITETSFSVKLLDEPKDKAYPWAARMSDGAVITGATKQEAEEQGRLYAYARTPIVIGARHQGYTVVAAFPDGERRFIVIGQDSDARPSDQFARPFMTWRLTLGSANERTFEDVAGAYATLPEALEAAVHRAGLSPTGLPASPRARLL